MNRILFVLIAITAGAVQAQQRTPNQYVPPPLQKSGQASGEAVNLTPAAAAPVNVAPNAVAPTPPLAAQPVQPSPALPGKPVTVTNTPASVWSPIPAPTAPNPWQPTKPAVNPWEPKPAPSPWK